MSKNAIINIKTDPDTKRDLKELADELGLSVSALLNADIRRLIRERRLELDASLEPTPYLENVIREVEKDRRTGKNISPTFGSAEEMFEHLEKN